MAVSAGPDIAENGLILFLDAGNKNSYSGTGTAWIDISGAGNVGSFVNGVTFDPSYGGNIAYDGADEAVTVPMTNLRPTSQITQECWFSIYEQRAQVFIGSQRGDGYDNSYALWLNGTNTLAAGINPGGPTAGINLNYQTYSYTLTTNRYYHYAHTYDGTTQSIYVDGDMVYSWGTTGSIFYDTNNTLLTVGNDWCCGYQGTLGSGIRGNLPIVRIYNRALNAFEIKQNYTATRKRFDL